MRVQALLLLLALAIAGCEGFSDASEEAARADTLGVEAQPTNDSYEVILVGSMADTLQGAAHFGKVVDAETGKMVNVIRLETGFDFGGGFFLSYGAESLPPPGQYSVEAFPSDSLQSRVLPEGFSARYRRGLLINLRATGGTLTLDAVTDTLVSGSFDITMEGLLSLPGGNPRQGTTRALGRFEADAAGAGYIIGF